MVDVTDRRRVVHRGQAAGHQDAMAESAGLNDHLGGLLGAPAAAEAEVHGGLAGGEVVLQLGRLDVAACVDHRKTYPHDPRSRPDNTPAEHTHIGYLFHCLRAGARPGSV